MLARKKLTFHVELKLGAELTALSAPRFDRNNKKECQCQCQMASTSNDSFDVSPWLQLLEKEMSAEERQKEVRQLIQQALSRLTLNPAPEQPKATPPPLMSGGHPVVRWDQPHVVILSFHFFIFIF